jgi:Flp pilus assembly protein TadD
VFNTASWSEAVRYLEQAVAIEPNRLVHHLDLARIYRDVGRKADARTAYAAALRAPIFDANDPVYRQSADDELRALR